MKKLVFVEEKETCVASVRVDDIRPKYDNLKEWIEDEENNIYIGRGGIVFIEGVRYPKKDSIWGNPYKKSDETTLESAIDLYKKYITKKIKNNEITKEQILELKGKNLGCWCKTKKNPNAACHGDVLLEILKKY
jgi:hypothetical protein